MLKSMYEYGIGNTSMVELPEINGNRILMKLEKENYLGSTKARNGYQILCDLPETAKGRILIESSSGNLGLALGAFSKLAGYRFICLVDSSIAQAKLEKLEAAGIEYMIVEAEPGYDLRSSRIRQAQRMMDSGTYYWVNQYDNEACVKAHEISTGPEIWSQTAGTLTHCICPMGSGGTISGISRYLKRISSDIHICGVEPYGSTIYGTVDAPYINVGAGLVGKPGNILRNPGLIDSSYTICDEESIRWAQMLYTEHGLGVGVTTGMAYGGALRIAEQIRGATIVIIAPDGRESYREYLH